jgi:hypothetical protein
VGALGPAYTGALVSLAFQGEVSRSCYGGAWSSEFLCVLGSRTYHWVSPGAACNFRGGRSGVLTCRSFFLFFLWLDCLYFQIWRGFCFLLVRGHCGCLLGSSYFLFWESWLRAILKECQQPTISPPSPGEFLLGISNKILNYSTTCTVHQ